MIIILPSRFLCLLCVNRAGLSPQSAALSRFQAEALILRQPSSINFFSRFNPHSIMAS